MQTTLQLNYKHNYKRGLGKGKLELYILIAIIQVVVHLGNKLPQLIYVSS